MHELANHAVLRADLGPHLIWDDPRKRDEHHQARAEGRPPQHWPRSVNTNVEPVVGHDALGEGITVHQQAAWRCRCQRSLALDHRDVPRAWAQHVARETGLPEAVLADHMLVSVGGLQAVATCACGQAFTAPADDPTNGDAAAGLWADHVAEAAA